MSFFSGSSLPKMNVKATSRRRQPVMNDLWKTAFERGFKKAAAAEGMTEGQAIDLLKQAILSASGGQNLTEGGAMGGLVGGGLGAGVGALTGYMGGQNKENPEEDHRYRDAILGMLLGGGLGAAGGAGLGAGAQFMDPTNHVPKAQPGLIESLGNKLYGKPGVQ